MQKLYIELFLKILMFSYDKEIAKFSYKCKGNDSTILIISAILQCHSIEQEQRRCKLHCNTRLQSKK